MPCWRHPAPRARLARVGAWPRRRGNRRLMDELTAPEALQARPGARGGRGGGRPGEGGGRAGRDRHAAQRARVDALRIQERRAVPAAAANSSSHSVIHTQK